MCLRKSWSSTPAPRNNRFRFHLRVRLNRRSLSSLSTSKLVSLDSDTLQLGVECLVSVDPTLAAVVDRHGPPPLWKREPSLPTLIRIILEQQVSLASGAAIFGRLEQRVGDVTVESILALGESGLRGIGITRQKASYCVAVVESLTDGSLDLDWVSTLPDARANDELRRVKGIGHWTADCYLLMALGRPDVWPKGDVALHTALQHLDGLSKRPTSDEAAERALRWRPWRAVAARILWHGYLQGTLRSGIASRRQAGKE